MIIRRKDSDTAERIIVKIVLGSEQVRGAVSEKSPSNAKFELRRGTGVVKSDRMRLLQVVTYGSLVLNCRWYGPLWGSSTAGIAFDFVCRRRHQKVRRRSFLAVVRFTPAVLSHSFSYFKHTVATAPFAMST